MSTLTLPSSDIRAIQNAIAAMSFLHASLPDDDALREMLDVVFFSSLEREEGRAICVAIAYVPSCDSTRAHFVRSFARPIKLDVDAVRKLALAIDPWRSVIAVEPAAAGGLQIWGLGLRGRFAHEPLGGGSTIAHLIVRATGPGVIEVESIAQIIWLYKRGVTSTPSSPVRTLSILARAFPTSLGDGRPFLLLGLARRIAEVAHGGTLAVLRSDQLSHLDLPDHRRFEPLREGLLERWNSYKAAWRVGVNSDAEISRRDTETKLAVVNQLADEIDAVATLAALDGAVLLASDSLAVIGFGAKFTASGAPPCVMIAKPSDSDVRKIELSKLGGTRHQSAAEWCYKYGPTGFVLVVSQDGAVSFLRCVGNAVFVASPLQLGQEDTGGVELNLRPYREPQSPQEFLGPLVPPEA
jgi:hypothetical protein